MPVYDAFNAFSTRIIHSRHEAAAVFMAEAYAAVSGQIGVALVTAGPGFGNALGALFSASRSEVPVVLLSGDSPVSQDGKGAFQQFEQVAAASPFVKLSLPLSSGDDPAEVFTYAASIAQRGIPGPVHIALPFDLLNTHINLDQLSTPEASQSMVERGSAIPSTSQVARIADILRTAQRPLILAGPHLFRGEKQIDGENLATAFDVPVITLDSPRGLQDPAKGALPSLLSVADYVIYLGKSIDFSSGFGHQEVMPAAKLIIINEDVQTLALEKNRLGERLIAAEQVDPAAMVSELIGYAADSEILQNQDRKNWCETADTALHHRQLAETSEQAKFSKAVVDIIAETLTDYPDAVLVCDGGEFGQWAQAFVNSKTRLTNGPAGAIGGSLSYAIGAKIARPDVPVIAIMGDGTAGFHFAEFETAARESLGITVLIGNDSRWNAEHHIQLQNYGEERAFGCELSPGTRYDIAAEGFGCDGELITELCRLPSCLATGLDSTRPTCINVIIPGAPAPQYSEFDLSSSR